MLQMFPNGRPGPKVLAGTLIMLGVLAVSASPAIAAPAGHAVTVPAVKAVPDAGTSVFTAFSKTNGLGTASNISGCGVHNMPFAVKSYTWTPHGQSGDMYNQPNAGGGIVFTFSSSEGGSDPNPVGWESIRIVC